MKTHDTITNAARSIDVPRKTLASAIDRGEVKHMRTPGGCCLVHLKDAKRWSGVVRKRGRKPS